MFEEYCTEYRTLQNSLDFAFNNTKYLKDEAYLNQLKQIQNQTELIHKIMSKSQKESQSDLLSFQSSNFQNIPLRKSESMVSIYSLSYDLNNLSHVYQQRIKFGGKGSKCLFEIKQKCQPQTYEFVSKIIQENRKNLRQNNMRNKQKSKAQGLSQRNIILHRQVQSQQGYIDQLKQNIKRLNQQNKQISKRAQYIQKLQIRLLKKQESLLHQRRICNNLQKQVEKQMCRLQQLHYSFQRRLEESSNQSDTNIVQARGQPCSSLSKSAIDGQSQHPQISQLWAFLNKFEDLCQSIQC